MRLLFLGTTGYHPNASRHTACLMLPELGIVLDAGTGFFRVRDYLQTRELHIFLSHAHVDHTVGLTYLFDVLRDKPVERVVVYGADRHLRAVGEHLFSELLFPATFPYPMHALDEGGESASRQAGQSDTPLLQASRPQADACGRQRSASLADRQPAGRFKIPGEGTGIFRWQEHGGGSLGYKFCWPGCSLAYITDTRARPEDADFLRGVDLLVHECYFPDTMKERAERTFHSHASAVAELARQAGVGRLFLVHVNPLGPGPDPVGLDGMRAIFPETHLAADLLDIEF